MKSRFLLSSLGVVLLGGCTLAPHYERPAAPVANTWPETGVSRGPGEDGLAAQTSPAAAPDIGWEEFFGDARLKSLIRLALENNRDLRIAALNLEQVRARYRIAELAFIPTLDANGSMVRSRSSGDLTLSGRPQTSTSYSVSADVSSYELDFFGRVRSLRDEALEVFLGTEEARRAAHIALVAEVARQYLNQRAIAEELRLAEDTLKAVNSSFRIAQKRHEVGAASRLDLATAETQVQLARADVSTFRQQLVQADNALSVLIGGPLPADLPPPAPLNQQGLLADISPGIPSDLLQRRPDILQAEHQLRAANAQIGAARAAFFPSITLTAGVGTASDELSRLFASGTGTWNFVPKINLPIFAAGQNRAALDVATIQKRIEIARYEGAIQNAFREVADALVARARVGEQIEAYDALARAQQERFTLTETRYRQGVDSYLAVLIAQQDLYAAQQNQIRVRLANFSNLISLYRALGGGWNAKTTAAGPAAP
ncbi:MAG: efflux transporter outer membrane subunit [Opitutus sp.]